MSHIWEILKALGPWGLLIVSTVESLGIPNPGGTDWLLVFMAIARPNDAALCAAMAVLGRLFPSRGEAACFEQVFPIHDVRLDEILFNITVNCASRFLRRHSALDRPCAALGFAAS